MNDYNGYGEIKLGETTLPFKFGTNAYRLLCQHRNIDLDKVGNVFRDPFGIYELAYFAHITALRMRNETTELNLDAFIELVGDEKGVREEFEKLIETSKTWGYTMTELIDKGKKKT